MRGGCASPSYAAHMALECVLLLRLPGDHRAMVSEETARLGEWMGELKRLDAEPGRDRPPLRTPRDTHRV